MLVELLAAAAADADEADADRAADLLAAFVRVGRGLGASGAFNAIIALKLAPSGILIGENGCPSNLSLMYLMNNNYRT